MGKIVKRIQELLKKNSKNHILLIFMVILFEIFLFMQHRMVGMYFDDFGNASLSYAYDAGIDGTNYSIYNMLDWAAHIYMNWGGRVLYALILIPLLKNGVHLFMAIQTVIVLLTMLVMWRIAKKSIEGANDCLIMLCFIIIYGLLQGDILTMGFYWASASVLYVWPVLPFMLTILLYSFIEEKIKTNKKITFRDYIGLIFTIPLTTLSQEQIGGALLVWFICNIIFKHNKEEKKYAKSDCIALIYTIVTFGIFFAAPGNWVRMATNESYADMSFAEKMVDSFPKVLDLLTNYNLKYFNIVLALVGILVWYDLINCKKRGYIAISLTGILPFLISNFMLLINKDILSDSLRHIFYFIFLIDMFFMLLFYFSKREKLGFISIMIAGVASIFCLILSPAFSLRSCIPYIYVCMILCAVVVSNCFVGYGLKKGRIVIGCVFVAFGLVSLGNSRNVYKGYEDNYFIDCYNFDKLKNYNGEEAIVLITYPNAVYRSSMSCDTGYEFVDYWMKEYFAIPQNVMIEWKTIAELQSYAKLAMLDINYGDGFYEDEGGYRWSNKDAEFVINNKAEENRIVAFSAGIVTGYEAYSKVVIYCNGNEVYSAYVNKDGIDCEFEIELVDGENIFEVETDAQRIEAEGDSRELYMRFSSVKCELN